MPRKQNGFGSSKSFAFKPVNHDSRGKRPGAAGYYPSNRSYGASINRSVIEQMDLNSDWVKWRKGLEYYYQAAWHDLKTYDEYDQTYSKAEIYSKLYQGTDYELDVLFTGYKFATQNSDTNNHYVMKREVVGECDIGQITSVGNDMGRFKDQKANREVWTRMQKGPDSKALYSMIGDRVTDGETSATLDYILNGNLHPELLVGKTAPEFPASLRVTIPRPDNLENPQDLVGELGYFTNFFREVELDTILKNSLEGQGADGKDYFSVSTVAYSEDAELVILDCEDDLPISLYDIGKLEPILTTKSDFALEGNYYFSKELYQKYYGSTWLSVDLALSEVTHAAYAIAPFEIFTVTPVEDVLFIEAVPMAHTLKLYAPTSDESVLIFKDWSFTQIGPDTSAYHQDTDWQSLNTDVNPWMDEVFTTGEPLRPETIYSCSCPNYSNAMLRAPQETQDEGTRKVNRQRRYPMPTVLGKNLFEGAILGNAAGLIESWETREQRLSYKQCKHSIAAKFIEHIKTIEPSQYPSFESREKFEEKLQKEIASMKERFDASYRRGGITALEVIFSMAQGLNLDDVELTYIMLSNVF